MYRDNSRYSVPDAEISCLGTDGVDVGFQDLQVHFDVKMGTGAYVYIRYWLPSFIGVTL